MNNSVIRIDSEESLRQMRTWPDRHFVLEADIDLMGKPWEPLDFRGTLEGQGHKISNMKIDQVTTRGHQGFFGCLEKTARVSGLWLTGLQIVGGEANAIGGIAGCNRGEIEDCILGADAPFKPTKSGKRNILQGDCDNSFIRDRRENIPIGAAVGDNRGSVTGIKSWLQLLIPGKGGLCGKGEAQGLWRDVSGRTELQGKDAQQMRKTIVDYMFAMGDVRWIPQKDMAFTTAYADGTNVVYAKDVPHYGLPYTQKYGPLERMSYCIGQDDYVKNWLSPYSDAGDTDPANTEPGWDIYLGNDCSGAVFWSWARCCASVSFEFTGHMLPTEENQKEFGVLPVGNYTAKTWYSLDALAENDPNEILEGYAKLRMADAIVMRSPAHGHTRLVFRDPVVMRDEKGVIDREMSYLPTHEQGVGKGSSGRDSTWQLSCRYTFRELLQEYLPITNKELLEGKPAPVQLWTENITDPFSGKVCSNYRVISTTLTLKKGEVCHTSRVFTTVINKHLEDPGEGDNIARGTVTYADLARHKANISDIPSGEYEFSLSVLLSTGVEYLAAKGQWNL